MGESGPEVILPLHKNASGELGVKAEGGEQQPQSMTNHFYIHAVDAKSFHELVQQNPESIIEPILTGLDEGHGGLIQGIRTAI
jgi:phage-related minor tail protein